MAIARARQNQFGLESWDPFRDPSSMREMMNRMLDTSFGWALPSWTNQLQVPINIDETDEEYRIEASLPGIRPEDAKVTVQDNVVQIEAERKEAHEKREGERTSYSEQTYGRVARSITLPTPVDVNASRAEFHDGILCLALPKSQAARPKQIPVRSSEAQPSGQGGQVQREQVQVGSGQPAD